MDQSNWTNLDNTRDLFDLLLGDHTVRILVVQPEYDLEKFTEVL